MLLALTGGIASGKSTVTARLAAALGARVFDSDREARRLVDDDPTVRAELRAAFGPGVIDAAGHVDRPALRARVFADPADKRALEGILHPRIRNTWLSLAEEHLRSRPDAFLILDIPLLFETGAEAHLPRIAVVGCRVETQVRRLMEIRRMEEPTARSIIASQLPLGEKTARAQHVIWNDSTESALHAQTDLLIAHLRALAATGER